MSQRFIFASSLTCLSLLVLGDLSPKGLFAGVDFERDIASLIARRCLGCHNASDAKGGLNLTTRAAALKGGDTSAALVPGDVDASFLLQRVAAGEMPPAYKGKSQALPAVEVTLLKEWIRKGAAWPSDRTVDLYEASSDKRAGRDWWSLQPVVRPTLPEVKSRESGLTPIDRFVVARLEAENLSLAPLADRRTLIRRAYFDLIGLPPTPEETAAFVQSDDPDAYARLIDELLARPQYGERWARYWLDLVRFAETNGYERDATKPFAWRYRDYVIQSFNDDKPYDRFVLEQLAGDELEDRTEETVVATGFLRLATWDDEPNDPKEYRYDRLEDLVHTTSSAFLGYTVKCARCHDHKFDPIPQADYYRLASVFWAGYIDGGKLMGGPDFEQLGYQVLGWTDRGREVEPFRLLQKGDPNRPVDVIDPAPLTFVAEHDRVFEPPPSEAKTTRRRLQLARWMTDPTNPLIARVVVNRLWQHHFGFGIVRSANNFGFKGDLPTHPQLLDWLASEFVECGWKLKPIHRQIMLSRVYREASEHPQRTAYEEHDFLNRFLWRANPRRLDAEALRDSMLSVTGELNLQMGGPSFFPRISHEALVGLSRKGATWGASTLEERRRRSVYIFSKRSLIPPLLTTFDFCDTTTSCAKRTVTTVAPQALALLNNHFVHGRSAHFARRLVADIGTGREAQIRRAWQLAFGREPSADEITAASTHVEEQAKHFAAKQAAAQQVAATDALLPRDRLRVWLKADSGLSIDGDDRIAQWRNAVSDDHSVAQPKANARPHIVRDALNGHDVVRFGGGQFLIFEGHVLTSQLFSVFIVLNDRSNEVSHRTIFSNWKSSTNNTSTSAFLGFTGRSTVRFSDDFSNSGDLEGPAGHFLLTAISGERDAIVYHNDTILGQKRAKLAERALNAPYVLGRQGELAGEYWQGDIAELLVYDRQLNDGERTAVWRYLNARYDLDASTHDPQELALASLCHVLLNANEFIYVD